MNYYFYGALSQPGNNLPNTYFHTFCAKFILEILMSENTVRSGERQQAAETASLQQK